MKDFSIELESIASADKETSFFSPALMINAYYHFNNNSSFTPYVGFGTGSAQLLNFRFLSNLITAYQGKVGLSYSASNATEIFAGYRFFNVPNNTSREVNPCCDRSDTDSSPVNQAFVEVGLRFNI